MIIDNNPHQPKIPRQNRLEEIRLIAPDFVDITKSGGLSAIFEFKSGLQVTAEQQIGLCRDFSTILGGAQKVTVVAASPDFMAVNIAPKAKTFAYSAEVLETCANGSMFDAIADTYGLRSLDFTDEDHNGGIDYDVNV